MSFERKHARMEVFRVCDMDGKVIPNQYIRRMTVDLAIAELLRHWVVETEMAGSARRDHQRGWRSGCNVSGKSNTP